MAQFFFSLSWENNSIMFAGQSSRSSRAWLIQKLQRMWWWWRTSCSLTLSRSWLWSFAEEFVLFRLRIIRVREAVKIKNVFYAEVRLKDTQANHGPIIHVLCIRQYPMRNIFILTASPPRSLLTWAWWPGRESGERWWVVRGQLWWPAWVETSRCPLDSPTSAPSSATLTQKSFSDD